LKTVHCNIYGSNIIRYWIDVATEPVGLHQSIGRVWASLA